jgi:MoaA/NifB/PqqE/SkfB family radical SAM enzyme
MAFNTLALMLGYRCNIQCRSCLWGDQHSRGPDLKVEEGCQWIDESCEAADVRLVGFSGGESFLYLRTMTALMRHCHEAHHLPSAISTNSYWALSEGKAEELLRPLVEVGLQQLLLSVDDFHQEHIPLERVGHALRAGRNLGLTCTLQAVVTHTSGRLQKYLHDLGVQPGDGLQATEVFCTRMGWAATRIPAAEFPAKPETLASYCSMLGPLIIRPEGTVHLCCGPAFAIPGLTAGNLRQESLKSILERAEWDPILTSLALHHGPSQLAKCLENRGMNVLENGFSSSCEACHKILSAPAADVILREELAPQQAELFLKHIIMSQETRESLLEMVPV